MALTSVPRGTVADVTVALVGHTEVQGVGPDGHATQRGGDRRVVVEVLIGHHVELLVTADPQVGSPHAHDRAVGYVGETLDDQTCPGHFGEPVVVGTW